MANRSKGGIISMATCDFQTHSSVFSGKKTSVSYGNISIVQISKCLHKAKGVIIENNLNGVCVLYCKPFAEKVQLFPLFRKALVKYWT